MAYWLNSKDNTERPNQKGFMCDSNDDIRNLPTSIKEGKVQDVDKHAHEICSIGSTCLSLSGGCFILNSKNKWVEI